jgi:tRNA (cytidine/uridine-2'-O-)-methyltransferase
MFRVILYEPEIPPNAGNIIRLCANTGCELHLIEPLGFRLDHRAVRRAGLDYAELTQLRCHANLAKCLGPAGFARLYALETTATRCYATAKFEPGDALLFGSETRGLPAAVLQAVPVEQRLALPMRAGNRSLNLANAVAVVVYEAWRQQGYRGAAAEPRTRSEG